MSTIDTSGAILDFLERLDESAIHYTLAAPRPRMLMANIAVPGERWEVEFGEDAEIDAEVFVSRGGVEGAEKLTELFDRFSD